MNGKEEIELLSMSRRKMVVRAGEEVAAASVAMPLLSSKAAASAPNQKIISGSPTSRTYGRPKGGCLWQSFWICTHVASSVGRCSYR